MQTVSFLCDAGSQKRQKQVPLKISKVDKLDDLVDKYKSKYFGPDTSNVKRSVPVLDKRWFD